MPGTNGLGKETILLLASHGPAHIYFTGRNKVAAHSVIAAVKAVAPAVPVTFLLCDQTRLASVKSAACAFLAQSSRLDVLICNAGIMGVPAAMTEDGYEIHMAVNHLAHALLIKLLLPALAAARTISSNARVVILTSTAFAWPPTDRGVDIAALKTAQSNLGPMGAFGRYCQSKLANLLYTRALAQHHQEITAVSAHPGTVNTGLVTGLHWAQKALVWVTNVGRWNTPRDGALNSCWASMAKEGEKEGQLRNGGYYEPVGMKGRTSKFSESEELREKLWRWTEAELERWMF